MKILITEQQLKHIFENELSDNIFKNITNAHDYDEILNNVPNRYIKDRTGEIIKMTPEEYYVRCSEIQRVPLIDQYKYIRQDNVNKLIQSVESGNKLNLPWIDYVSHQQEGRHRVMAAKQMGYDYIYVAIFKPIEEDDDEMVFTLNDVINYYDDVKKDENGTFVIYYDTLSDYKHFKNLYPNIDGNDLFYYFLSNKRIKLDTDKNLSELIYSCDLDVYSPEILEFFVKKIKELITYDDFLNKWNFEKEDVDNYLSIGNLFIDDIIHILKDFEDYDNRIKMVYDYIINMINSVHYYQYYYYNDDFFNSENKSYNVEFIPDQKYVKVYSKDNFGKSIFNLKSGKEIFDEYQITLNENEPYVFKKNGDIILTTKNIKEYMAKFPLK